MPTFKKDTDGFMGKPSGFKMKYSPNKKTAEGFPFKAMGGVQQYDASPMRKDKKVPSIPKKSPDATVKMLQAKKDAGTITDAELKRLRELQKMMETGPGSYGNEQYDKE